MDKEFDPSVLQLEDAERDELAALAATLYYARTQEEDAPTIASGDGQAGPNPWRRRRRHAS